MKVTARRREGFTHDVEIEGGHSVVIDEPEAAGGNDLGPAPGRVVAAALAACTAITVEMYADRKGWELGQIEVETELEYGPKASLESFTVTLHVPEPLDADQEQRLLRIAGKCPVHRALSAETEISIDDRIESGRA